MNVPVPDTPWLLLTFSLPARRASQRVDVWRKLQRTGALALRGSGHLLPDRPEHRERFEWLATAIRGHGGSASVMRVTHIDNMPARHLVAAFVRARTDEYDAVLREAKTLTATDRPTPARVARIRRRLTTATARDFFGSPGRQRVEALLAKVAPHTVTPSPTSRARSRTTYRGRLWVTRSRPGVDRTSSAWLIRRFIDPQATFGFVSGDETIPAGSIPFDMFVEAGFGHRGDDCTFETLRKAFRVRDNRVRLLAEAVHDADLGDEKFGRTEAIGVDHVLTGWARQGVPDDELLRRGMDLFEGLYHSHAAPRNRRRGAR